MPEKVLPRKAYRMGCSSAFGAITPAMLKTFAVLLVQPKRPRSNGPFLSSPKGSKKVVGEFDTYAYLLIPPRNPLGSSEMNLWRVDHPFLPLLASKRDLARYTLTNSTTQ